PHVETLAEFGTAIGIAFQLSDDLLDIASESEQSGKTPGTDLREGVPTLPMLYALAADDTGADVRRLKELLSSGPIVDDTLHAEALGLLRESAALNQARETVQGYASAARRSAGTLPESAARRTLEALCHYIADRTG
ncbi:MAG TPA: polyprenyl synthetase family protein, partial [Actinoplanes sp.]|nr:polyprenyl synthetase family protein [Actinoplanes sp.]